MARLLALAPTEQSLRHALEALRSANDVDAAAQATALGALYHSLAHVAGDSALLVDALEHTEHALELEPSSDAARFNRALVESDLGLCRRASESWADYLRGTRSSPWTDEARLRRATLPCEGSEPPAEVPDLLFEAAVEDLLPRWTVAHSSDPREAHALLGRIERHGERLSREAHDPWLSSLVRQLRRADLSLVSAVRDYVRGRALFASARYREAEPRLLSARSRLPEDNALIPWCDLWIAGARLHEGDFDEAERILESHRRSPEVERSPLLAGRIAWALALAASRAGRLEAAHDGYVEARRTLESGSYRLSAAWVRTLEADALAELGFVRESWRARVGALRDLQGHPDRPALHSSLLGGARAAVAAGRYRAAHVLVGEAAALAEQSETSPAAAEALLARGDVFREQGGEGRRAREAYRRGLGATRAVRDPLARSRLEARARLGLWDANGGSGRPLAELERVIRYFADRGPAWREIQALRVKARAMARGGDPSAAESVIDEAIARIREVQSEIGDGPLGFRHWESLQDVFDEAIELALASGRPATALALLEEARRAGGAPRQDLPFQECFATDAATDPRHPGDASSPVTIVYGALGDRLVWWRIDRNRCSFGFARPDIVRTAVGEVVERVPSREIELQGLEDLYRELLRRPLHGVAQSRPLILVPDRYLLRLPFAALRNPETGRYLAQERALSFRLGLQDDRPEEPRPASPSPRRWRALVVGDPSFDRRTLPWLPRLAGAAREARQIASLYPHRATLLTGAEATAARIQAELQRSQVLHLAAHAVPGANGMRDVLVLADEGESGSSGLVSSQTLVQPGAPALDLVVLSACSTLGTTPSRSGGLLGLARPFVAGGTSAVVGTLWPLDDRVLAPIMIRFHEGLLAGLSASESLRRAQIASLESDSGCCDWAGVQLVGEIEPGMPAGENPESP